MADALLGGIVINEILVDPNGALNFDTDGNGTAESIDEYVELYNSASTAIDISGLQLWDAGVGNWFTFPAGTILDPGGHALVLAGVQSGGSLPTGAPGDLFFDAGRASALINNGGDNVTVYDPVNDAFIQATYNGDTLDDPTAGAGGYAGFSSTAVRNGAGEDFGSDTDGRSLQRSGDGSDMFVIDTPTPGTTNVCFADGTFLATPQGDKPIEQLQAGDGVLTADNGVRPIAWTFSKTWSSDKVAKDPRLAAVRIDEDALGAGLPSKVLRLSQQHRLMVQGPIAKRMFGSNEVLIPAKALLALPGVSLEVPATSITYFHIMLSQHEVIFAHGVPTESLYLGQQALASIPQSSLEEIRRILRLPPRYTDTDGVLIAPARTLAKGKRAKKLVERHLRNQRPLVGCHAPNR